MVKSELPLTLVSSFLYSSNLVFLNGTLIRLCEFAGKPSALPNPATGPSVKPMPLTSLLHMTVAPMPNFPFPISSPPKLPAAVIVAASSFMMISPKYPSAPLPMPAPLAPPAAITVPPSMIT